MNYGKVFRHHVQKISSFNGIHDVNSGRVVVVDAQTFLIPRFSYDGQAPDAHFWVGNGNRPGPEGKTIVVVHSLEIRGLCLLRLSTV